MLLTRYTYLAWLKKQMKQILSIGIIFSFVNIIKLLLLIPQSVTLRHALLSYLIVICTAAVPKKNTNYLSESSACRPGVRLAPHCVRCYT